MLFKSYYLVQAHSHSTRKLQTQFNQNELARNKELMDIHEAKRRCISYADSLNESVSMNANDWKPVLRLITDAGKYIVDLNTIQQP